MKKLYVIIFILIAAFSHAQQELALVIGNGAYNRTVSDVLNISGEIQHPEIAVEYIKTAYLGARPATVPRQSVSVQPVPRSRNLKGTFIGIALPNPHLAHWISESNILKTEAEKRGFRAEIQWADNDQDKQNEQIKDFLNRGVKALIIANVDAYYGNDGLASVLSQAALKKVPVICYDRFIKDAE
jgi:ABC-type sugar transport system substrate-binding protein